MPLYRRDFTGDVTTLWCLESGIKDIYVLAGIGSQIYAYNLAKEDGDHLKHTAFEDGTRVHGIHSASGHWGPLLAVHGGRQAKVFLFRPEEVPVFVSHSQLGPFSHWTLDINVRQISSASGLCVVGLSNNSISVFRITASADDCHAKVQLIQSAQCTEKLLLYSLSLHAGMQNSSHVDIWVAAGTVFLDVLVWHVAISAAENTCDVVPAHTHHAALYRLKGHDGSIHRVCWAPDGSTLASASDDRTVRVWALPKEAPKASTDPITLVAVRILYGHEARVWDVRFWGGLMISASEDCTCRIWKDDQCVAVLQGHRGRGVWRTAMLPHQQLATAGADGSVKIWSLAEHVPASCLEEPAKCCENSGDSAAEGIKTARAERGPQMEAFTLLQSTAPFASSGQLQQKLKGSKGDWVRSMALASHEVLYVGTNAGRLQRVHLPHGEGGEEHWEHLWENGRAEPLVCIAVTQLADPDASVEGRENLLANRTLVVTGEQSGWASLLGVSSSMSNAGHSALQSVSWHAHGGTPVLNAFWVPCFGSEVVITAALDGTLRLWTVSGLLSRADPSAHCTRMDDPVRVGMQGALLAEARSPFGVRILRLDVDVEQQLLVCGDRTGNVLAFHFDAACLHRPGGHAKMPLIAVLKHAHQSLPVSLVSISPEGSVATGSHEGSIQHYMLTPPACTSKTDSRLRSMFEKGVGDRSEQCASEGVVLSELQEAAGSGERAAHDVLDTMQVLSLDERRSCAHSDQQPSALSEVDALILANVESVSALTVIDSEQHLPGPSGRADRILSGFQADDWIVFSMSHRCELARVRCGGWRRQYAALITSPTTFTFAFYRDRKIHVQRRRDHVIESSAAGQGRGGSGSSGVRSLHLLHHGREIQCVALMRAPQGQIPLAVITGGEDGIINRLLYTPAQGLHASVEIGEHAAGTAVKSMSLVPTVPGTGVMISGGAKEVLMAWQLTLRGEAATSAQDAQTQPESKAITLEHRWLSTRPPPKGGLRPRSNAPGCNSRGSEHRYMAVVAFANGCSADVIGIVAASSDATLRHLSFDLKSRRWAHVANLCYHTAPVLSLAHASIAGRQSQLVLSGATDGAVAVWNCASDVADGDEQQPVLALPGLHQSGVNAMSAACLESSEGACRVLLATGGDDQALRLTLFNIRWQGTDLRPVIEVAASAHLPNAHSSALRGVWTDGRLVASLGLDQRLRTWTTLFTAADSDFASAAGADYPSASKALSSSDSFAVSDYELKANAASTGQRERLQQDTEQSAANCKGAGVKPAEGPGGCQVQVEEGESIVLQVLEPSALHVLPLPAPKKGWDIAVVGRGTQVILCEDL